MGGQCGFGAWQGDRSDPGSCGVAPLATLRARLLRPQLEWTPESPEVLPWIPTSCVELAKKMGMRGSNIEKGQTEGVA